MHLQRTDGCDNHHSRGNKPGCAALYVKEFLGSEVGSESGFGNRIVTELHCGPCRYNRIAAVRDVGKRSAVNYCRGALKRLDKVRLECIAEKRGHCSRRLQVARRDRLVGIGISDDDT